MWNYGDVMAWLTVLKIVVVLGFAALTGYYAYQAAYKETGVRKYVIRMIVCATVAVLALVGLFMFFGSGKVVVANPADEDGHTQMLAKHPEPPAESVIDADAEAKKNSYLKRMDESPARDQAESEAYLKTLLKRNTTEGGAR